MLCLFLLMKVNTQLSSCHDIITMIWLGFKFLFLHIISCYLSSRSPSNTQDIKTFCSSVHFNFNAFSFQYLCLSLPHFSCLSCLKVILLADSIRSQLLSWFGSPIIKKLPEYHPPNVYKYVEIWMYIMSKYSTIPNCSNFDFCNESHIYALYCMRKYVFRYSSLGRVLAGSSPGWR
jgi:hypothetical protein